MDWELTRQKKQTQINRDNTRENKYRVEYDHKVRDDLMFTKSTAYKYETPYMGTFLLVRCCSNGTVSLQIGAKEIRYNIGFIKPYKSDTKVEDTNSINMYENFNI